MKPILFEQGTTDFSTNGLGRLADAISCLVSESRNGAFELTLKYPISGIHRELITKGRIIYAIHDDSYVPQPFDIYKVVEDSKGTVTAYARHIAYRLQKCVVMPSAFIGESAEDMLEFMAENIVGNCPFSFHSDITGPATTTVKTPLYPVSAWSMLGDDTDDHVLYNFPGEWKYDGFDIYLLSARGTNRGIKVRRGKNATNIKATVDISDQLTGVVPYWTGTDLDTGDDITVVDYDNPAVYASDAQQFAVQQVEPLDLTDAFETRPTVQQVKDAATEWLLRYVYNNRGNVNYAVDLTDMRDLPEALRLVRLCDTITLEDAVLGLRRSVKVVKTTYDAVSEVMTRIEVGSPKMTLSYAMRYAGSGSGSATVEIATPVVSSSSTGSTSTNTHKQSKTNAVKIKALEKNVATLNQGGGGGGGGGGTEHGTWDGNDLKVGGANNDYGRVLEYDANGNLMAEIGNGFKIKANADNQTDNGGFINFYSICDGVETRTIQLKTSRTHPSDGYASAIVLGNDGATTDRAYTGGPVLKYNASMIGSGVLYLTPGPDKHLWHGAEAGTAISCLRKRLFELNYGGSANIIKSIGSTTRKAEGGGSFYTETNFGRDAYDINGKGAIWFTDSDTQGNDGTTIRKQSELNLGAASKPMAHFEWSKGTDAGGNTIDEDKARKLDIKANVTLQTGYSAKIYSPVTIGASGQIVFPQNGGRLIMYDVTKHKNYRVILDNGAFRFEEV